VMVMVITDNLIWCTYGFHVYRASNSANNIATNFGLLNFDRDPWGSTIFSGGLCCDDTIK
ncbi:MAG: hypothetical protein WAL79_00365, partial [Nitrososphaeraceae archaeon]